MPKWAKKILTPEECALLDCTASTHSSQTYVFFLKQRSPTFLARGTGFVEDGVSTDGGGTRGDGPGGNASDGERQMQLPLLARRSPPAVRPGS